ncbi:MAG: DUF1015 domain-containing protein [Treponema sp.]|jgi:hypothetical protein|nr:DUF1015 domain-containing protein [Treponema sp.]
MELPPLEDLGLAVPGVLLPRPGVDLAKWAVIACDQYTQDRSYWERADKERSGAPSALDLVLPEIYLEDRCSARIRAIHGNMKKYLEEGIFAPPRRAWVYLERNTSYSKKRRGLLAALDLERYDFRPEARSMIRATEGTVPERLPVRMEIRRGAPLEIPHVIVLIDDEEDLLLPGLAERTKQSAPAYETSLMLGGGEVSGWFLDREKDTAFLTRSLADLAERSLTRYGPADSGGTPFLYAAGDGNHSLAAAKEIWEEYKKNLPEDSGAGKTEGHFPDHPARWALVEIENLYDPAVRFEPIHRIVFNACLDELLALLAELPGFSRRELAGAKELSRLTNDPDARGNRLGLLGGGRFVLVENTAPGLAAVSLQPLLDRFVKERANREASPLIDYIHGGEELFRLTGTNSTGILLPPVKKNGFFESVARTGPLPRKSFSMGESREKRYYLECRQLGTVF